MLQPTQCYKNQISKVFSIRIENLYLSDKGVLSLRAIVSIYFKVTFKSLIILQQPIIIENSLNKISNGIHQITF